MKKIIIGSAFGHGAKIYTTAHGPKYLKEIYQIQKNLEPDFEWHSIIDTQVHCESQDDEHGHNFESVLKHNTELCQNIKKILASDSTALPIIIGGDHSCAIGTWSAVTSALEMQDRFGLIWIDAHMDAHTVKSSGSKAFHGMPLSVLLNQENNHLSTIGSLGRKIHPENLVLIGIRSYEKEEEDLLQKLDVKIYYMPEVLHKGMLQVLREALEIVNTGTLGFGVSIDLDSFDPIEAPGVGSPEASGLRFEKLQPHLTGIFSHDHFKCLEIAEFNPSFDDENKTAHIITKILQEIPNTK